MRVALAIFAVIGVWFTLSFAVCGIWALARWLDRRHHQPCGQRPVSQLRRRQLDQVCTRDRVAR